MTIVTFTKTETPDNKTKSMYVRTELQKTDLVADLFIAGVAPFGGTVPEGLSCSGDLVLVTRVAGWVGGGDTKQSLKQLSFIKFVFFSLGYREI